MPISFIIFFFFPFFCSLCTENIEAVKKKKGYIVLYPTFRDALNILATSKTKNLSKQTFLETLLSRYEMGNSISRLVPLLTVALYNHGKFCQDYVIEMIANVIQYNLNDLEDETKTKSNIMFVIIDLLLAHLIGN